MVHSYTFSITGRGSHILHENIQPAIELDASADYAVALIGFHTFNSIPNVEENVNNVFLYGKETADREFLLPTGSYEIADLEAAIQNHLVEEQFNEIDKVSVEKLFTLKPNNNTLRTEIKSDYFDIDFTKDNSLGRLLGFSNRYLEKGCSHQSDLNVEIIKVTTISLECNLVSSGCSYRGGYLSHTLYSFSPSVNPGFAINIEPNNLLYLPVRERYIDHITITILDQHSKPVNFRDEEVTIRLELKKVN